MQRIALMSECPTCGSGLKPTPNLIGGLSTWFGECINKTCRSIVNMFFEPTEYQLDFLSDNATVLGYFGGYGAGKTASTGMKIFLHALEVTGGETLIGAATWAQMLKTNVKELAEIIPSALVEAHSISLSGAGARFNILLKNGHRIWGTVMDDEGKLRSLNLTAAWLEEASNLKQSIFTQIQTRMRSSAGKTYVVDEEGNPVMESFVTSSGEMRTRPKEGIPKYLVAISSNPDPGWIRTEILYKTEVDRVKYYGDDEAIASQLKIDKTEKNPFISSYVVPTYANYHLPKDFIPMMSSGKTQDWINRYVNGSFSYAEGLVYPTWQKAIVEPFEIPKDWRRLIASDFGRVEATTHIVGAIDPDNDILYLYGEYKKGNGAPFMDHVDGFWKLYRDVPQTAWMFPPIGDPAGQTKGQTDRRSWFDLYAEQGIFYIPSRTGKSAMYGISDGITLVNEYLEAGKLKIFSNLVETIDEISNYRYKTVDLMEGDSYAKRDENPVAYKDHIMDALRGMISMMPRDVGKNMASSQSNFTNNITLWNDHNQGNENDPYDPAFWKAKPMTQETPMDYLYGDIFGNIEDDNGEIKSISEEDLYGF